MRLLGIAAVLSLWLYGMSHDQSKDEGIWCIRYKRADAQYQKMLLACRSFGFGYEKATRPGQLVLTFRGSG